MKTKLIAMLAGMILITAVNLRASAGDVIPCRFEVDRQSPPFVVFTVEWKLEPFNAYQLQYSTDLTTWHDMPGGFFIAPEPIYRAQFDAVGFGGPDVYFVRMIDADQF